MTINEQNQRKEKEMQLAGGAATLTNGVFKLSLLPC